MTRKIFYSVVMAVGIVLVVSIGSIMGYLYRYFERIQENDLKEELNLAIIAVEENGISYLEKVRSEYCRFTWIAENGTVLYDTIAGTENKENHLGRVEVQRALETGEGKSNRYSDTLLKKTMYYAKQMKDGSILRISVSNATVWKLVIGIRKPVLAVVFITLLLSGILAGKLSKWIVKPLNHLDLEHPLENNTYEEISPLLSRINRQHHEIKAQFCKLQQQSAEFAQITSCMNEGLVLMDLQGVVLSINPAAKKIFALNQDSVGKDFLTIYRDHEMSLCIKRAMESGRDEIQQSRFGREYQFEVSRIESAGEGIGAVLIIFDITEKVLAERNRREFTANVSHELKTPLQGIIGSAELIENSMVKQEDLPRFVGHIRKEASRLVILVEDIIRLSQLDEKAEFVKEEVDLYEIAKETAENLKAIAKEKKVEITVSGEQAVLLGVRKLLYEIIYNLCDNAIKYNVVGGRIELMAAGGKREGTVAVTVSDTGVGIPKECIGRVFERFYRVDKSHSKNSGGTGLGLSIVKHAVAYHSGEIEIMSEVGKGTVVRAEFPV